MIDSRKFQWHLSHDGKELITSLNDQIIIIRSDNGFPGTIYYLRLNYQQPNRVLVSDTLEQIFETLDSILNSIQQPREKALKWLKDIKNVNVDFDKDEEILVNDMIIKRKDLIQ